MYRIEEVKTLGGYKLWLKFADGTVGEVDLSGYAGKGVFRKWEEPGAFEKVAIGSSGELVWGDGIDLCPDTMYMRITGKRPEDLFPALKRELTNA